MGKATAVLIGMLMVFSISPAAVAQAEENASLWEKFADGPFIFGGFSIGLASPGYVGDSAVEAQGQYMHVSLRVENTASMPKTYFAGYQTLVDGRGRVFAADTSAALFNNDAQPIVAINPGNTLVTSLFFDVPIGSAINDYFLVLRASGDSAGIAVDLPPGKVVPEIVVDHDAICNYSRSSGLPPPSSWLPCPPQ